MDTITLVEIALSIILMLIVRVLYVIHKITTGHTRHSSKKRTTPCKTLICIGSGGHTTEMLELVKTLDFTKYCPRLYVVADSDKTSLQKIELLEKSKGNERKHQVINIPRSRKVHQSYFTSIFTTLYSTLFAIPIYLGTRPDLILCNGPGTCIPLCVISFLFKCFGFCDTRIVFIESYCRTKTFSLSGRILTYIADNFLVQWPSLKGKLKRSEYIGQLL